VAVYTQDGIPANEQSLISVLTVGEVC